MKYTKTGFPYVKTPYKYLHHLYKELQSGNNRVGVHCTKDKNHSLLHDITWVLINDGYIVHNIDSKKDSLFIVKLTMRGIEYIENCIREKNRHFVAIVTMILSAAAAIGAIGNIIYTVLG